MNRDPPTKMHSQILTGHFVFHGPNSIMAFLLFVFCWFVGCFLFVLHFLNVKNFTFFSKPIIRVCVAFQPDSLAF